jgi:hypothetical protein
MGNSEADICITLSMLAYTGTDMENICEEMLVRFLGSHPLGNIHCTI